MVRGVNLTRRNSGMQSSTVSLELLSPEGPAPPSSAGGSEKRSRHRRLESIKHNDNDEDIHEIDDNTSMMTAQEGEPDAAFITELDDMTSNPSIYDDDLEMYTVASAPTPESIASTSGTPSVLIMKSKRSLRRHIPFRAAQPTISSTSKSRDLIKEREDAIQSDSRSHVEGSSEVVKTRVRIKDDIIVEKSSQPLLTENEERRVEDILSSTRYAFDEDDEEAEIEVEVGEGFSTDATAAASEDEIQQKLQSLRPDLDICSLLAPIVISDNHRTSKELSDRSNDVHNKLDALYRKAAEEEEGFKVDIIHGNEEEYHRRLPTSSLSMLLQVACQEQGTTLPIFPDESQPDMTRLIHTPIPIHNDIGSFEEGDSPMEPEKLFYNTMSLKDVKSPEPDEQPPPPSYGEAVDAVDQRQTEDSPPCDILFFNIEDGGDEKPEQPIISIPKERKLFLDGNWDSLLNRTPEGFLNRPNSSCSLAASKQKF